MPSSPHLHPMSPDSLRPRPAPQAAASPVPGTLIETAPVQPEPMLRPASFAAGPDEPLFPDFLFSVEEEDDDSEPDAVPTESMPVPACVPLFDFSDLPQHGWFRKKG